MLEKTTLPGRSYLGLWKYLIILYFPSLCVPFAVGSHLKSQIPLPPYSLFSGKTQFPAVISQLPTHSYKFDVYWHPAFSQIVVSLSKARPLLAAAQCLSSLSQPSLGKFLHLSALPPSPSPAPHSITQSGFCTRYFTHSLMWLLASLISSSCFL